MRAWDAGDEALRAQVERRADADAERLADIAAHGIDMDPAPEGRHRHGDLEHASDHEHPHAHSGPGERPVVGIVGAGAVGTALGVALDRAGWPVGAVASRDPGRRDRFRSLVRGARGFAEATALVDDVELVILAVPDDVVPALAATLRLYSGQAIVHTSGLLGAEALLPALAAGSQAGAFHPLVAFADLDRALAALHGATIAIEGDEELAALLAGMAEAIGGSPVRLAPGSKAAYHAAAVLAAGGVTALLDTIREIATVLGLDEAGALRIYLPLLEQTVANARALGIAAALTGPATRGDAGTVAAHLDALRAGAPAALPVYRALLERDVAIADSRARCHRKLPDVSGPHLQGTRDAVRCGHAAQHRGPLRGVACAVCPPHHPGPPAASRAAQRARLHRRPHRPDRAAPAGRRTLDRAPCAVALAGRCAHAAGRRRTPAPRIRDVLDELGPRRGTAPSLAGAGVARLKQATATSAGGIVIRFVDDAPQLVICRRSRARDGATWTLPKGTPNAGETTEETALREVREETGLEVRIIRPFESIEYAFVQGRTRIHKTVHYFLMVPTGGDLGLHDHEFDEVRWIGFGEAAGLLTFETERALVARAAAAATDGSFPGAPAAEAGAS